MSLFSWLSVKPKASKAAAESSGLSRLDPAHPANGRNGNEARDAEQGNGRPAKRKGERMARRELLYTVVRDAMMRAGVLSASYKFKVLSLDARGRQFLVMVDLARDAGGQTSRLAEIEAAIAQSAKSRYDIIVTAVYWRSSEHVAVGTTPARAQLPGGTSSRPMPLDWRPGALDRGPAALETAVPSAGAAAVAAPAHRPAPCFEPIDADEVAAFRRALATGTAQPAPAAADPGAKPGPRSYTLLTGFEDTELPDGELRSHTLSGTQFGELR